MLKQELKEELKQSMLARDELRTSVLRMLLSAIGYYEIQKGGAGYEADDQDVMLVIEKQAKQRRESIEQFKKGLRPDLADKEEKELELLKKYLPEQLGDDTIKRLVDETIVETAAKSVADTGKVMSVLVHRVRGKADLNKVSLIVKEELSRRH